MEHVQKMFGTFQKVFVFSPLVFAKNVAGESLFIDHLLDYLFTCMKSFNLTLNVTE